MTTRGGAGVLSYLGIMMTIMTLLRSSTTKRAAVLAWQQGLAPLRHRPSFYAAHRLFAGISSDADADALRRQRQEEFQSLDERLQTQEDLYYNVGESQLTDDEYDALKRRHGELAKELNLTTTTKERVGAPMNTQHKKKRTHLVPMLSLSNVVSTDEVIRWMERLVKALSSSNNDQNQSMDILTEPKLDGLGLSLRYHPDGSLEWASTRGDGRQGKDVTEAVRSSMSHCIPTHLLSLNSNMTTATSLEVRGEVVMYQEDFRNLKLTNFSNARNAASGILLRQEHDDALTVELRSKLQFFAYDLVAGDNDLEGLSSAIDVRNQLQAWGFQVPTPIAQTTLNNTTNISLDQLTPLLDYHQALQAHRDGKSNFKSNKFQWQDYDMDGCVHKVNDLAQRAAIGSLRTSPKWAVAHKFPPQAVVTTLHDITIQVGRTGALTPVAILEPVDIARVSVQRATLHNFGHLQALIGTSKIPKGTQVLVRRAGDVIPQVTQFLTTTTGSKDSEMEMISMEPPQKCPACGSPTVTEDIPISSNATTPGQVIRCSATAFDCPPRAVASISHAISRDAIYILGLSQARIQQLHDAQLLHYPYQLFETTNNNETSLDWNAVAELPGWGTKSIEKLQAQLNSTSTSLSRYIYSLGIRHVGLQCSIWMAQHFQSVEAFLEALERTSTWVEGDDDVNSEEREHPLTVLEEEPGIGPVVVASLVAVSQQPQWLEAAKRLAKAITVQDEVLPSSSTSSTTSEESKPWAGFKVVFTGSIPGLSRTNAQALAKSVLGAKATPSSVSSGTSLVVSGNKGGKKLDRAMELGIPTMAGEEYIELLKSNGAKL